MSTPTAASALLSARTINRLCGALFGIGVAAFIWGALSADPGRTVAALVSSWLFFTGIAAGGLAFTAILNLCGARWAEPLYDQTVRLSRFLPASALVLVAIIVSLAVWAPWAHAMPARDAFWLETRAFAAREVFVSVALFAFAWFVVRPHARANGRSARIYVTYALLYAIVLSIWSFDFVVGPIHAWNSTLIGPHLFVGAFMSGGGVAILLALYQGTLNAGQRRDAATLVFVLAIFWAYQCWAQFLTMWYGNLPEEIGVILRRSTDAWRADIAMVILGVAVLPFVTLISAKRRQAPRALAFAVLSQLIGLWVERDLMVTPALGGPTAQPLDVAAVLVSIGMMGLFLRIVWPTAARAPQPA